MISSHAANRITNVPQIAELADLLFNGLRQAG